MVPITNGIAFIDQKILDFPGKVNIILFLCNSKNHKIRFTRNEQKRHEIH